MRDINFALKEEKAKLEQTGMVLTVRGYKSDSDIDEVWVENVGTCERKNLGEIYSLQDLEIVSNHSGFDTFEDWIEMVNEFKGKDANERYLYSIKKI